MATPIAFDGAHGHAFDEVALEEEENEQGRQAPVGEPIAVECPHEVLGLVVTNRPEDHEHVLGTCDL